MIFKIDLEINLMTLILKLDLEMVKMYLYSENEIPSYSSSKVIIWTDRPDWNYYLSAHADGNNVWLIASEHFTFAYQISEASGLEYGRYSKFSNCSQKFCSKTLNSLPPPSKFPWTAFTFNLRTSIPLLNPGFLTICRHGLLWSENSYAKEVIPWLFFPFPQDKILKKFTLVNRCLPLYFCL